MPLQTVYTQETRITNRIQKHVQLTIQSLNNSACEKMLITIKHDLLKWNVYDV